MRCFLKFVCCSASLTRGEFVRAMGDVFFANSWGSDESNRNRETERIALWRKHSKGLDRFVINPNARWLGLWNTFNRLAGVYVFLDVPFRIAFHPFGAFGFW